METSSPKIILHIGFHKTGSSALQYYLFSENNEKRPFDTIFPMCTWLNNADLAWACLGKRFPWQDREYNFDHVIDHYKKAATKSLAQGKDLVISSEEFCRLNEHFDPKFFTRLADVLPLEHCKVLAYIRDPLQFLTSRYCHEVMYDENRSFGDFVAAEISTADFRIRLKPWMDYFGSSRMCIRQYQSGDIVADFNQQFNYAGDEFGTGQLSVGAGVDFALAELFAAVNRAVQAPVQRNELRQTLSKLPLVQIPKSERLAIIEKQLPPSLVDELKRLTHQQLSLISA